jgi:hypothetical protein
VLSDESAGKRLWSKLLGDSPGHYEMTDEGTEYRFDVGQFVYGSEIERLGACLDAHEDELLERCPTDVVAWASPRGGQ